MSEFRISKSCPVPHIENCPDCFGFGMIIGEGDNRVLTYIEAEFLREYIDEDDAKLASCPTCRSTAYGATR